MQSTGSSIQPSGQEVPTASGYDYRLLVTRELYDLGINTQMSPSLAGLPRGARAHVNPADLERLGVAAGTSVRVGTERGSVVVALHPDAGLPRWTVWMPFNQPGANVGELIDIFAPVNDVRIENI